MRKGFTMIELIFVIVILGVLASVAIPRLAATRDDAEVAKAATNLTTAVSDLTAYYTAKGSFHSYSTGGTKGQKLTDFTKVTNALTNDGKLRVKNKIDCVSVALPDNATTASGKVELTLTFTPNADAVCAQLAKLPGIVSMCKGGGSIASNATSVASTCKIQIGGSGGINF